MAENDILSIMEKSKLFQGVDAGELTKLCAVVIPAEKDYARNQIIINQGEPVKRIGILKNGSAISVKYHFDGDTQILRIYHQGEVLLLDAVNTTLLTSPVTLISQTDSTVVFIPYAAIFEADSVSSDAKARIRANSSELLSNELIRLMYKIDVLSKRTLRERILTYLSLVRERSGGSRKPDSDIVDIDMTQEQFAQYLCVNRSVLSAELSRMRKSGLIDYKGSRFIIIK
jgi:CRP-like cAMP-binding protein